MGNGYRASAFAYFFAEKDAPPVFLMKKIRKSTHNFTC